MPRFIPCPKCEQHIKPAESACPHCGAKVRDATGAILKTATAAMLGLVAVAASCSDSETTEPVAEYGPAPTVDAASTTTGSSMGGTGGTMGQGGEPIAEYGPAPTTGAGGGGGTGGA